MVHDMNFSFLEMGVDGVGLFMLYRENPAKISLAL